MEEGYIRSESPGTQIAMIEDALKYVLGTTLKNIIKTTLDYLPVEAAELGEDGVYKDAMAFFRQYMCDGAEQNGRTLWTGDDEYDLTRLYDMERYIDEPEEMRLSTMRQFLDDGYLDIITTEFASDILSEQFSLIFDEKWSEILAHHYDAYKPLRFYNSYSGSVDLGCDEITAWDESIEVSVEDAMQSAISHVDDVSFLQLWARYLDDKNWLPKVGVTGAEEKDVKQRLTVVIKDELNRRLISETADLVKTEEELRFVAADTISHKTLTNYYNITKNTVEEIEALLKRC